MNQRIAGSGYTAAGRAMSAAGLPVLWFDRTMVYP